MKSYLKESVRWNGALWKVVHNPCGTVSVFRNGRKVHAGIASKVIKNGEIEQSKVVTA